MSSHCSASIAVLRIFQLPRCTVGFLFPAANGKLQVGTAVDCLRSRADDLLGRNIINRGLHLLTLMFLERSIISRDTAGAPEKMSLSATRRCPCQRPPLKRLSSSLHSSCPLHAHHSHLLQVPANGSRCSRCSQPSITNAGAFWVLLHIASNCDEDPLST